MPIGLRLELRKCRFFARSLAELLAKAQGKAFHVEERARRNAHHWGRLRVGAEAIFDFLPQPHRTTRAPGPELFFRNQSYGSGTEFVCNQVFACGGQPVTN